MLYDEFLKGTGLTDKNNEKIHRFYLKIENAYMLSDITKDKCYKLSKAIVEENKNQRKFRINFEIDKKLNTFLLALYDYNTYYYSSNILLNMDSEFDPLTTAISRALWRAKYYTTRAEMPFIFELIYYYYNKLNKKERAERAIIYYDAIMSFIHNI